MHATSGASLQTSFFFLRPSSDAPEVLFFLGTSVCIYQKANARVNVRLELGRRDNDNEHLRATINDLQSQEDNLIPPVN
jgi:hypothetical protein